MKHVKQKPYQDLETVGQVLKYLSDIPPDTKIVNTGHFGEVDRELCGMEYKLVVSSRDTRGNYVVLSGFSVSYPEPD